MPGKGVYHYKCAASGSAWKATAFGDMAEDMPECEGASMYELEKAMVAACSEASGMPGFNYACDFVTPKTVLFTACIGTAKAGSGPAVAAGGAAPAAAGGAAAAAKAPEPEPEEEEEDMGFVRHRRDSNSRLAARRQRPAAVRPGEGERRLCWWEGVQRALIRSRHPPQCPPRVLFTSERSRVAR